MGGVTKFVHSSVSTFRFCALFRHRPYVHIRCGSVVMSCTAAAPFSTLVKKSGKPCQIRSERFMVSWVRPSEPSSSEGRNIPLDGPQVELAADASRSAYGGHLNLKIFCVFTNILLHWLGFAILCTCKLHFGSILNHFGSFRNFTKHEINTHCLKQAVMDHRVAL